MKLYELNRGDVFKLLGDTATPPAGIEAVIDGVYTFQKVDGMYSICRDKGNQVVHLAAWSDVEKV